MFHYGTCCVRWCTLCINQRYKEAFQKNLRHPEEGARLKLSQTIDMTTRTGKLLSNWQPIEIGDQEDVDRSEEHTSELQSL